LGTLYVSLINRITAAKDGVFYLRIEDTDKKREVEGGVENILSGLKDFGIKLDEGWTLDGEIGSFGPYKQSERGKIYRSFAKSLVEKGLAYPCFCTAEELDEIRALQESQNLKKGYYKEFAKIGVTNRAQHSDAINKFIKENLLPSVTFDATVMSLANAFERCLSKTDINPYVNAGSDLASNEGSYLIACCMYTAITGKSPVGILRFESDNYSVKPTVGAKLQAIAAEVVLDLDNVTPAQVTDSYKERTEINVLLAGANICENDVADMLKAIAKETGKELNVVALTKAGTVEQIAADNALSIQLMYGGMEYDYIIVEAGKDNVLYDTEAANAQAAAVNAIRELALQNNKNAKVMILAPAARQNTVGQYFRDQVNNNGIATRTDYADLIEAKTKALAGETETVISYANAVEACLAQGVNPYTNSVADSLSLKGEYLAACAIYAEIFQASPATAVYVPDGITADEAAAIHNAAVMAILD
ncbi:MAG: hypothetical protein IJE63_01670, partial [Clostridia bacterium]|nr:hypothetical protein [Clostridia bacterium]